MPRTLSMIAGLAVLATIGCGGGAGGASASPSPSASPVRTAVNTCAKAHQSKHVAYLVVQHVSGQTIERCAGFDGDAIDGASVMQATGIQFQAGSTAMCQIDHEPLQFSDCSPEQAHWSLWLYSGSSWSEPKVSYAQLQLHDREALGWRYVVSPDSSPSPPPTPRPL